MKKDVLKLEYQNVFDDVACRIIYQNENVFKRGKFHDVEIGVQSVNSPDFYSKVNTFFIRGIDKERDERVFLITKEQAKILKEKVKLINDKYSKEENWRAEIGENYYYINCDLEVDCMEEGNDSSDESSYKSYNYFRTKKQASEVAKIVKKVLKKYHKEIGE